MYWLLYGSARYRAVFSSIGCSVGVLAGDTGAIAGTMAGSGGAADVDDAGVPLQAAVAKGLAAVPTKPVASSAWYIFIASSCKEIERE